MLPQIVVGVLAVIALSVGGYFVAREESARKLAATVSERFEAGDYLAALGAAERLKSSGRAESPELAETIRASAELLLAEDSLAKAKQALEEKRPADARALLAGSPAVTNSDFKYYAEARKVLAEAEALAAGAAHQTAVTIATLKAQTEAEEKKRKEADARRHVLEGSLKEKETTLAKSKAEIAEAQRKLEDSRRETEAKQTALLAEQARARKLMEQVEKESKAKFFSELRTYRDMAQRGREQLDAAVSEMTAKRDVTALIYLSQGKILFEEAKRKAADVRANRTPAAYQSRMDDFLKALDAFLEAAKQLRNAVVYIEEQGSAEFTGSFSKGKDALGNAASLLSGVSEFIAANPSY